MSLASPETAAATAVTPPVLRLLPAPSSEPPYDDGQPEPPRLRLVGPGRPGLPPRGLRPAPPPLRLVPTPGAEAAPAVVLTRCEEDLPARTPLAALPPVRPFAQALVQRLVEVLAGLRPLSQLQRDTSLELFEELERRLTGRPRPTGVRPSPRDLRSLHVQSRQDGVAEVCATVRRGGRTTALALRLEGRSGAWRCTALAGL